jgi:hypothetical protein
MQMPEALIAFCRLSAQKYKVHVNSDLQSDKGGQYYLAKCGQGQQFYQ